MELTTLIKIHMEYGHSLHDALRPLTKNSGSSYNFCFRHSSFWARSCSIPLSTDGTLAVGGGFVSRGGIDRNTDGFFLLRMRFRVFLKKRFSDEPSARGLPPGAKLLLKATAVEMPRRVVMPLGANAITP